MISDFEAGLLPLENGATLRAYLSEKLNCNPMRISKKFAGDKCLGKVRQMVMPAARGGAGLGRDWGGGGAGVGWGRRRLCDSHPPTRRHTHEWVEPLPRARARARAPAGLPPPPPQRHSLPDAIPPARKRRGPEPPPHTALAPHPPNPSIQTADPTARR